MTSESVARAEVAGAVVAVAQGDLTRQEVDAIVNAANPHLKHGGGLAAAIVRAGGREIQAESDRWVDEHGPLTEGVAAVTGAGELPARHVIHTAGPVYEARSDRNEPLLRAAVRAALDAAQGVDARSLGLPIISAGVYGYPQAEAAAIIADAVVGWLRAHPGSLDEVRLVGYDAQAAADLAAALAATLGEPDGGDGAASGG